MTMRGEWGRVKDVLAGALARAADGRQAYLDAACRDDAPLRAEVERLLELNDRAGTFLETPAARLLDDGRRSENLSGRVIGSYRLAARLGAGGMGDVYLAHDAKLDRPVALKFLAPEFAENRDRLRRFHQEARAASTLNHPHIVVVHDFGELEGRPYLVTEYVEGASLRERLRDGRFSPLAAVETGIQIASGLAAAHARGLIHRDIKPDNVMLRPDGYVKVLDFGLAKLLTPAASPARSGSESRTEAGAVIGTPRYMSPEQARGLELDARSDVWSLGVVLYEMVAGEPPFGGATAADAIANILRAEPPPLTSLAPDAPAALAATIDRALRKDRLERQADAGEVLTDLRRVSLELAAREAPLVLPASSRDNDSDVSAAGERRRATVLVSVVANYASLVERLAGSDVEQVVARIRAAAVDTMRRHGGVVNQSIGEEIVSLFGIPAAHEDDDLRAIRAAFELHGKVREIATMLGDAGRGLRLQSGVHAASVAVQRLREGPRRYGLAGPLVETAARLATAAEPDAIWLSPDCHRRVAPFVRTEPRPAVATRGDAAPLTPHSVLGESGLDSRLEAPERGGLTPYSGRAAELEALEARVDLTRHGAGQVVVISGEPGVGKSRLLHELRTLLASTDVRVLQGRCRSYGGVTSYLPFIEALQNALEVKDADTVRPDAAQVVVRIRAVESSLEPFIPLYLHLLSMPSEVFPLPRHLRGEHLQAALLEALAAFFTSYAQRTPAVLLLEDWHWADDASREALRHLAEVVAAYPLMVAVTARSEGARTLELPENTTRVMLGPLAFDASLAIIKAVLEVQTVPGELARRLHERTGGNPFFLEEMCHALREAGAVAANGAEVVMPATAESLHLPDSVQAVIRSRIDRLPPDGREVLRVASVIGREFARRILRDAMGEEDLTAALDRLKSAGIIQQIRVVPDPMYRFKHVLTQEVAYESLLEHQRTTLHAAVGRAIAASHDAAFEEPLEILAHHFSLAAAWEQAVVYGMRAAARATELSQFADALNLLERVRSWLMNLPDDAPRRQRLADLLLREERLCETLGMRGRQLQLGGELIALLAPHGASERLAETYLRQGDVFTLLKRFDAADRALATALRMSREQRNPALERNALRSIGLLRWHQGRHSEALRITEDALTIDRQREDALAVAGDLSNLGNILRSIGQHERALATLDEALAMPVVAGDPIKRAYILHNIANVHRSLGNVGRALEYFQIADESSRAHMLPIQRSFHLTSIAHIHLQEGRLDECLRLYQEAVELSRRARHAEGLAQSLRMLGEVLFAIGREPDALSHLQEAAQLFAQIEDHEAEAMMRRQVALARERGGEAAALEAWERVRTLAQSAGDARAELVAIEGIGRVTRQLGRSDEAIRWFESALGLAMRHGERAREAALRNTLGVMQWERGAYLEALGHYEAALALLREQGDRVHEGLALNSIGVTLTRLHRYEEARTALEEALLVNRETGERMLQAHTLAALGEVAQVSGRLAAAIAAYDGSLTLRRELTDRRGEGWMLHHLSRVRAEMGDTDGATAASAAAAAIAADIHDAALGRACGVTF
jgi:serine/threonine protein kinase/tetratricopeptide (TPR) repeat protein